MSRTVTAGLPVGLRPRGAFRLLAPVMTPMPRRTFAANVGRIKAALEAAAAPVAD